MQISKNVSLRERNSFGFEISAEYFCNATSIDDVREALAWQQNKKCPLLILGGGSNTVFTRNVEGLVLHIAINELSTSVDNTSVTVNAGAAGAAPIQNIGAYGKEVCDNLISVDVLHQKTLEAATLENSDCNFDYRHSLFKTPAGSDLIVLGIRLELSTQDNPVITYQALKNALEEDTAGTEPGAESVFTHVSRLRQAKLPDPKVIGNAGSFFKNPVVPSQHVDTLRKTHPELPAWPQTAGFYKLPAAWLIDQAGWKGHRSGDVGVHDRQALVLVNHGTGSGQQIATLANGARTRAGNLLDAFGCISNKP